MRPAAAETRMTSPTSAGRGLQRAPMELECGKARKSIQRRVFEAPPLDTLSPTTLAPALARSRSYSLGLASPVLAYSHVHAPSGAAGCANTVASAAAFPGSSTLPSVTPLPESVTAPPAAAAASVSPDPPPAAVVAAAWEN